MKKIVLMLFAFFVSSFAFSQQITRFGVVDTAKVFQAYFKASAPMRTYESKKSDFQKEIDKRTEEIRKLKQQKNEALAEGNDSLAMSFDSEISQKTESLTEFTKSKNMELDGLKRNLQNSNEFYNKLYSVIERIAENEGFSAILSLQQEKGLLWYSPSVDITDKVIQEMGF